MCLLLLGITVGLCWLHKRSEESKTQRFKKPLIDDCWGGRPFTLWCVRVYVTIVFFTTSHMLSFVMTVCIWKWRYICIYIGLYVCRFAIRCNSCFILIWSIPCAYAWGLEWIAFPYFNRSTCPLGLYVCRLANSCNCCYYFVLEYTLCYALGLECIAFLYINRSTMHR